MNPLMRCTNMNCDRHVYRDDNEPPEREDESEYEPDPWREQMERDLIRNLEIEAGEPEEDAENR